MLCFKITPRNFCNIYKTIRRFKFTTVNGYITKHIDYLPVLLSSRQGNVYVTSSQRLCSTTSTEPEGEKEQKQETQSTDPVRNIYVFPNIKQASLCTKLKIFQTVAVIGLTPVVFTAYLAGEVSYLAMMSSIFIMGTSTVSLYLIGLVITRIVCIMMYNEDTGELYISHINFWGRRRNVTVHVSNFVPISDTNERLTDTYIKLDTYDKSESFLIFLKHCSEDQKNEVLKLIG